MKLSKLNVFITCNKADIFISQEEINEVYLGTFNREANYPCSKKYFLVGGWGRLLFTIDHCCLHSTHTCIHPRNFH